jgi:serine/threonine protein phosphatase PrpC
MRIKMHGMTHVGCSRTVNEDRFLFDAELGWMLICDGMGGHAAGDIAAELAVRHVSQRLQAQRETLWQLATAGKAVSQVVGIAEAAVQQACAAVYSHALQHPELRGMGTTLTLLLISGDTGVVVHVGDSRLYLIRGTTAQVVTSDHTVESELRRRGLVLSEGFLQSRVARMLTRCLGEHASASADVYILTLQPGDLLVGCSDGLSKYLADARELSVICQQSALESVPARLLDLAISRGGNDNITVVVGRVEPNAEERVASDAGAEAPRHIIVGFESTMPNAPTSPLS